MSHVAYYIGSLSDIDENTGKSMQQLVTEDGFAHGFDDEQNEYISRALTAGETAETAPQIIVGGNPVPQTGFTPPTPPFKPW